MLCSARCIIVKLWMILRISRRRWMEALCIHWSLFFLLLWVAQETSSICVIIESHRRAQIIIIIDNRRAAAALGYPAMRLPSIAHLQTCENLKISLSHIISSVRSRKVITIRQSLTTPNNVVIEALKIYIKIHKTNNTGETGATRADVVCLDRQCMKSIFTLNVRISTGHNIEISRRKDTETADKIFNVSSSHLIMAESRILNFHPDLLYTREHTHFFYSHGRLRVDSVCGEISFSLK